MGFRTMYQDFSPFEYDDDRFPPSFSYLPTWIFFTAALYVAHSIFVYLTPTIILKFRPRTATDTSDGLAARTFAIWIFLSALIRMYAATNVFDTSIADLAILSYVIELGQLVTECFLFNSNRGRSRLGLLFRLVVAGVSFVWMMSRRPYHGYYWDVYKGTYHRGGDSDGMPAGQDF